MAYRSPLQRRNMLSIVASFFVIAAGLCGCLVIAMLGGQNDRQGLLIAIGAFALIAMIPLGSLRPDRSLENKTARPGAWQSLKNMFRRAPDRNVKVETWKRKRTNFVSTPHGSDEVYNSFVPENQKPKQ